MKSRGRKSRSDRLLYKNNGVWGTSSADFLVLTADLYRFSKKMAESLDGNCSRYVLCGIPMLFSAWRCFVIEYEGMFSRNEKVLKMLTKSGDLAMLLDHYKIVDTLRQETFDLLEIRNEIIHPSHLPTGTFDNCPEYLRHLKGSGLLQSSGKLDSDYIFLSQLQSHKLFTWAYRVIWNLAGRVIESDPSKISHFRRFLDNFSVPGKD